MNRYFLNKKTILSINDNNEFMLLEKDKLIKTVKVETIDKIYLIKYYNKKEKDILFNNLYDFLDKKDKIEMFLYLETDNVILKNK